MVVVQFVAAAADYNCVEDTKDKILMNLNMLVYDEVGYDSLMHDVGTNLEYCLEKIQL